MKYKEGDKVVFKEIKQIGNYEGYSTKIEIGKIYTVSYPGNYSFNNCCGKCICISEIYGGWIPEEAVEPYIEGYKRDYYFELKSAEDYKEMKDFFKSKGEKVYDGFGFSPDWRFFYFSDFHKEWWLSDTRPNKKLISSELYLKSTVNKVRERGFVKGARFIDLVNNMEWEVAEDLAFISDSTEIYITVVPNPQKNNKSARIYKDGTWAKILEPSAKENLKREDLKNTKIWIGNDEGLYQKVREKLESLGFQYYSGLSKPHVSIYLESNVSYSSEDDEKYFETKTKKFHFGNTLREIFPGDLGIDPLPIFKHEMPKSIIENSQYGSKPLARTYPYQFIGGIDPIEKTCSVNEIENVESVETELKQKEKRIYF